MKKRCPDAKDLMTEKGKMKDQTLTKLSAAILAAMGMAASSAYAQEVVATDPAFTIEISSVGEDKPRPVEDQTDAGLQVNRRVDIRVVTGGDETGIAPGTGAFWISEDPSIVTPRLDVTAPANLFISLEGTPVEPVSFSLYSNYDAYIDHWSLDVYDVRDPDRVTPLATFTGESIDFSRQVGWDGRLTNGARLEPGQALYYVLTAYDSEGRQDRTHPRKLYVADSSLRRNSDGEVVGALDGGGVLKYEGSTNISSALQPAGVDTGILGGEIYGESNLEIQTIPVTGSRVRIHGTDVNPAYKVVIDGESVPVDDNGNFAVERIMPLGHHGIDVEITSDKGERWVRPLEVDVTGDYFFMVGIADVTVGKNSVSGSVTPLENDDHYDGDTFVDGRLAFYLKKKYENRYLVTAQLDTLEDDIGDIFSDLHKKDPRSILRRLDPDDYYLTYGDDSRTIDDTPSQGKFYARVDWDANQVLWGNYNTGLTGTEYASFNRSLYGARAELNSPETTSFGEHRHQLTAFGSEAQTAMAHGEFLGTGGSLYYMKHTDIVIGSEKIAIEVRDPRTERVTQRIELERGVDYEMDEMQGRVILNRPITTFVKRPGPNIIAENASIDGDTVLLIVDYEYLPNDFENDKITAGVRGKSWLTDQFGIGATYVKDNEADKAYELAGIDATFRYDEGTYVKVEAARSEGRQASDSYLSTDGGLTDFNDIDTADEHSEGDAYSVEARVNLAEISPYQGTLGAWWKRREAGFSSARSNSTDSDFTTYGAEADLPIGEKLSFRARASVVDEEETKDTEIAAELEYEFNSEWRVIGAISYLDEEDDTGSEDSTLLGVRVVNSLTPDLDVYVGGQTKVAGNGPDNDRIGVGAVGRINDKWSVRGEVSEGDLGTGADVGVEYKLSDGHVLYGAYEVSTDRTDRGQGVATVGERATLSNQATIFHEAQFTHGDRQQGLGDVFGLELKPATDWTTALTLQISDLEDSEGNPVERRAASIAASYLPQEGLQWVGKLEYRHDESDVEDKEQWLTTNRLEYRYNDEWTFLGRANVAISRDKLKNPTDNDAKFAEIGIGAAYRPVWNNRFNLLAKYSFLYDLQSEGQEGDAPDERSHVVSVEGVYDIDQKWSVGAKAAYKRSEIRLERDQGEWFDSDTSLLAARVEYHTVYNWDALAEVRYLQTGDTGTDESRSGALLGVYKHLGENFKVGVGYNFAGFNDDLTDLDLDADGWFINLVGKY